MLPSGIIEIVLVVGSVWVVEVLVVFVVVEAVEVFVEVVVEVVVRVGVVGWLFDVTSTLACALSITCCTHAREL